MNHFQNIGVNSVFSFQSVNHVQNNTCISSVVSVKDSL